LAPHTTAPTSALSARGVQTAPGAGRWLYGIGAGRSVRDIRDAVASRKAGGDTEFGTHTLVPHAAG
jgi:hypothetical protein